MTSSQEKCWICRRNDATSGEHIVKRTDIDMLFGRPTQASPFRLHEGVKINQPVKSTKASRLKRKLLCHHCNTTRTQPHDQAWRQLSVALNSRARGQGLGDSFCANSVFAQNTRQQMRNVHLFFVKAFGCYVKEGGIQFNLDSFADSILQQKAHPDIYLQICRFSGPSTPPAAGRSDLEVTRENAGGAIYIMSWLYYLDRFAVLPIYATDLPTLKRIVDPWHPRFGTSRLRILDSAKLGAGP